MNADNGQMALDISLRDKVSFDSFVPGHNQELIQQLIRLSDGTNHLAPVFVWGEPGAGKSHLLRSCFQYAHEKGLRPWIITLSEVVTQADSEEIIDGLDAYDLLLIDGLDCIAAKPEWEEKLFNLCNLARDQEKSMIISAVLPPIRQSLGLRDLVTRLMSGLTYQVLPLGDEQKVIALQERAVDRGFEVSEDAVNFILSRCRRDTGNLFKILDRIDKASLEQKRLITIPFLKSLQLE